MPSLPDIQNIVESGLWCIASVVSGLSLSGRSGKSCVKSASKIPPDKTVEVTRNVAGRMCDMHQAEMVSIGKTRLTAAALLQFPPSTISKRNGRTVGGVSADRRACTVLGGGLLRGIGRKKNECCGYIGSGGDGLDVFPILGIMDETNWTNLQCSTVISCSSVSKS